MRDFIAGHRSFGLVTPARRSVSGAPGPTAPVISGFSTSGAPDSMSMIVDVAASVYWMLDANATRTAAQIIAGGGQSSGSQAVSAGSVDIDLDFSAVADGTWYLHVVADNGASSNVIDQEVTFSTPSAGITREQVVDVSSSTKGALFNFASAITTGSAPDRAVVVILHGYKEVGGDAVTFSSVTLGGVAMTEQVNHNSAAHGAHVPHMGIFTLVNPTAGAKDLAVTMTQVDWALAATILELSGVDQAAPVTSTATDGIASGAASTLSLTTTTDGAWVVGGVVFKGGDIAPVATTGDAAEISDGTTGASSTRDSTYAAAAGEIATAGAASMTFTAAGSDVYMGAAIEVEPS